MASEADEEKGGRGSTEPEQAAPKAVEPEAAGPEAVDPKIAAAIAAAEAASPADGVSVRIDSWIWAVRLAKTRSVGAAACKGGHVQVNGVRVKAAHTVRVGESRPQPNADAMLTHGSTSSWASLACVARGQHTSPCRRPTMINRFRVWGTP